MVDECNNVDTEVGPSIAFANQLTHNHIELLQPTANNKKQPLE
jgi:hypothetical protein